MAALWWAGASRDAAIVTKCLPDAVQVDNAKEFSCVDVEAGWVATLVGKRI